MNCSVKFFEPTVIVVPEFPLFFWICFPSLVLVLVLSLLSSPPPHAATSSAHAIAASSTDRARATLRLIFSSLLGRVWDCSRTLGAYPARPSGSGFQALGRNH